MMLTVPMKIQKMHRQVHRDSINVIQLAQLMLPLSLEDRACNQLVPDMLSDRQFG